MFGRLAECVCFLFLFLIITCSCFPLGRGRFLPQNWSIFVDNKRKSTFITPINIELPMKLFIFINIYDIQWETKKKYIKIFELSRIGSENSTVQSFALFFLLFQPSADVWLEKQKNHWDVFNCKSAFCATLNATVFKITYHSNIANLGFSGNLFLLMNQNSDSKIGRKGKV